MTSETIFSGPFALRTLGTTDLRVTPLCIGCAPLSNMPEAFTYEVNEGQALETIRTIFAGSINFLDTAASYGDGESERRLGIITREANGLPPGFVLATKARSESPDGRIYRCPDAADY